MLHHAITAWVGLIWAAIIANVIWRVLVAIKNRGKDADKAAPAPSPEGGMSFATHATHAQTIQTIHTTTHTT